MKHGNTYTQLVTVKGVDLTQASSVILTLQPRSREPIRLTGEDMAVSSDGTDTTIAYKLTEEQSLYLGAYYKIDVNFMLGGNRGGTSIETVRARPTLLLEPIGGGDVVIDPDATEPDIAELTTEEARVVNAVSPHITTVQTDTGAVITITDIDGTHTVTLENGLDGRGIVGTVLNEDYTLTITFTDGTTYTTPSIRGAQGDKGDTGDKGDKGDKGESGVYVGTAEPTDPDINVWIDPSGTRTVHDVPAGGTAGQVLTKASGDDYDTEWATVEAGGGTVTDVQVNGTSVVTDGMANVPIAGSNSVGVGRFDSSYGVAINPNNNGLVYLSNANNLTKSGTNGYKAIVPSIQHEAAFYGLAKAAGDTTQSASSNAVGTYTDEAKAAIQSMLGISSATTLAGMTDVQITSPYNGQQLIYNSGKWRNQTTFIPTVFERFDIFEDMEGNYGDVGIKYLSVYGNNVPCGADYVLNAGHLCVLTVDGADNSFGCYPLTQILYDGDTAGNYCYIFGNYVFKAYFNDSGTVFVSTDGRVPVDGTTPTITAVNGFSYKCGTVTSLTITPPTNGVCSVRFTSGATTTALTATGVTFPAGFLVRANTIYDIHISDGLATVDSWAVS